jgi:type III secretion protein Q
MRTEATVIEAARTASQPAKRARRVTLTPLKRLTKAHLELAKRPTIRGDATAALNKSLERLGSHLGTPLSASSRVLDGALQPLQHFGRDSLFIVLELTPASALAVVELEAPLVTFLLQRSAGTETKTIAVTSLTRIETAAMGWLVLVALQGVRSVQAFEARFGPRLVSMTLDRGEALRACDAAVRHLAIEMLFDSGHPIGTARVMVPAKMLQLAISSGPPEETASPLEGVLNASLSAGVRIGRAQLLRRELGDLTEGDVIVFSGTSLRNGCLCGPARFITSSFQLSGTLTPDGFTLISTTPEAPMANTLKVDVEIELTTIQLPLRQLGAIAPGTVLPLHINAAQTVTLRIEGKPVALAELVEVEGEIGARVTAMLETPPS